MPDLINPHNFAISVAALGRDLAPYETVTVDDEKVVSDATATGVLHSGLEELDKVAREAVEAAKAFGREIAATWHREHGNAGFADNVPDADHRDVPFVSAAQVNHVEGQAIGDAQIAARADGVTPSAVLAEDGEPVVERRAGPTEAGFNPRESNIPPLSDVNPEITAARTPAPASAVTAAAGEEAAPVEKAKPDANVSTAKPVKDEAALSKNEAKAAPFQPEPVVADTSSKSKADGKSK